MRACLIDTNGVVINAILVGEDYEPPEGMTLVVTDAGNIGDTYANGVFTPPPPPEPTLDEQIAALTAEFERKKAAIVVRRQLAELTDGPQPAAELAALKTEYLALVAEYNAALDALIFGI